MRTHVMSVCLALIAGVAASAAPAVASVVDSSASATSAPSLATTVARADDEAATKAAIAKLVEPWSRGDSPGGVIGVVRRGETWIVVPFGLAEIAGKRAIDADTPFYIASAAKRFTAACVLLAADAKKLSLDDPITKHVSGLPDAYRKVTLAHLMHHRGGVKDVYDMVIGLDLGRAAIESNARVVELLRHLPELDFEPGTRMAYSNSGYVLLAEALRAATGTDLAKYAQSQLFDPLKMTHAHTAGGANAKLDATSYRHAGEQWERIEIVSGLVGPGGFWASCSDLAAWERAWSRGELANASVRKALLAPPALGAKDASHPMFGAYAGGCMVGSESGLSRVRCAGGAFGFAAEIHSFPEQETSVIVLSNASDLDASSMAKSVAAIVLKNEMRSPAAKAPRAVGKEELARFGRMWRDEASGIVWVLTLRPDRMVVASLGDVKFEVEIAESGDLVSVGTEVPVVLAFEPRDEMAAGKEASRMTVRFGDVVVARCRPLAFPPREPPKLEELAAEYELAAVGAKLRIAVEDGKLRIAQARPLLPVPPFVIPPFHALGDDLFVCDAGGQMQFTRDATGRVRGLRLDVQRARGFVLERR